MKLLSCQIENFGKLSGFSYIFEDGLNVLLAENGWGKSTLAAFLKVMFYGFEGENRRNEDGNERLRYRPWGGGVYGGTVTFSSGDRIYRIHRTFGVRKKEDSFLLFDEMTGLPSQDFTDNIGEELFGIDRASFMRTVFWSQQDHMTEATTMIQAKIGDLSSEKSDLPDYDRAIRQVQKEIEKLSPDRASGQIRKKEARAAVLEAESARLPQLKRQLADSTAGYRLLAAELDSVRKERQDWMASARDSRMSESAESSAIAGSGTAPAASATGTVLAARLNASRKRLETLQRIRHSTAAEGHRKREEYLRIRRERAREEHYASLAVSHRVRILRIIAAAALFAAAFFIVLIGTDVLPIPFIAAGILFVIGGFYAAFQSVRASSDEHSGSPHLDDLQEEELALRATLRSLSNRLKRVETQIRDEELALRSLSAQYDRLPASSLPESGSLKSGKPEDGIPSADSRFADELAAFDVRAEDCRRRLARTGSEAEDLRRQIRESLDAADRLESLRKELTALRRQYETCVKTASFLEEARSSFNSRYMNPFLRSFRRYYGMLTGESAENLQTDADFGITVMNGGLPRDPSLMSEGTRDLISLCRRMAMIDAMYPGEKPFLVLDDPFSNLDDERVKGGMRFLRDASFEYQILYMTCHASRM